MKSKFSIKYQAVFFFQENALNIKNLDIEIILKSNNLRRIIKKIKTYSFNATTTNNNKENKQ